MFEREREVIGKKFRIGDRVSFNGGFPGTIIRYYSTAMIEVRGERGMVCIDEADADLLHPLDARQSEWEE